MRKFDLNNFTNILKKNYIQLISSIFFLSFIFTFYGALITKFKFAGNALINIESPSRTKNKTNRNIYLNYRKNKLILENDKLLFPLYQKYFGKNKDYLFNNKYLSWKKYNFKIKLLTGTEVINVRYISNKKDEIKNLLTDLFISFQKQTSKNYVDKVEIKKKNNIRKINILKKNLYQLDKESFNETISIETNKDIDLLITNSLYETLLKRINNAVIDGMLISLLQKDINENINMELNFNNLPLIEQKKFILFCISFLSLLISIYIIYPKEIKSQ